MAKKGSKRELLGVAYEGDGIGGFTWSHGGRHYNWQGHGVLHDDTDNAAPVFLGFFQRVEVAVSYTAGLKDGGDLERATAKYFVERKENPPRAVPSSGGSGGFEGQ